jgi:hypothetical protein
VPLAGQLDGTQQAHNCRAPTTVAAAKQFTLTALTHPGSFAGQRRPWMELVFSGSDSLGPLSAIQTKPLLVQLLLSCWQRSIRRRRGFALDRLRSRNSAITLSTENSRRTTLGAVTRRRKRTRHICTDGFVRTGGTMNWLRSEQYRLKVGFDACLWRRAVALSSKFDVRAFQSCLPIRVV